MTTKQKTVILENSLPVFTSRIIQLAKDGWEEDPDMIATTFGFSYEIGMVREATEEQLEKDQTEANKPSRAEILARARAAKAAKKENN